MDDIMKFDKVKSIYWREWFRSRNFEQAEIQVKYSGYIDKERNNADKLTRLEDVKNPRRFWLR
jgi:tRNA uridine 5-carboxymethylaminomethyl modification enzyme